MKVLLMRLLLLTLENHPLKRVHITDLFLKEFTSLGNEIDTVLTSFQVGSGDITVPFKGGIPSHLLLPFFRWLKYFKARELIKNQKPDFIVATDGIIEGIIAIKLSKKFKVPVSYYLTSMFAEMDKYDFFSYKNPKDLFKWLFKSLVKPLEWYIIKNVDVFHPISDAMGRTYADLSQGKVLPLPMCPAKLFLEAGDRLTYNKVDKINLIYTGQVTPNRKLDFLIEIVRELKNKGKNIHLSIIGKFFNKRYKEHLSRLCRILDVIDNTDLIEEVPMEDLPTYMVDANIGLCLLPPIKPFVVSSPTKVQEYLAMGIPVVANREIEDQRIVIENSGGGMAPPYEIDEIVKSIIQLSSDPYRSREMGRFGREWVIQNRDYSKMAEKIQKTYYKIILEET